VANCWQRVEDLIGSGFKPHTSRTRSELLTTCAIKIKMQIMEKNTPEKLKH